ncbi:hypothetical protein B0H17DRAFT_1219680 [Mycena rosella]|uniref:Uncharacterized protein n=1 Tax=Mycena rosella TaxID=1033263 RepID=A0AAD7BFQ7_MYCRO|nr:hypothetical protein B0H17DRAFT_1219680 [Mycena rosella]
MRGSPKSTHLGTRTSGRALAPARFSSVAASPIYLCSPSNVSSAAVDYVTPAPANARPSPLVTLIRRPGGEDLSYALRRWLPTPFRPRIYMPDEKGSIHREVHTPNDEHRGPQIEGSRNTSASPFPHRLGPSHRFLFASGLTRTRTQRFPSLPRACHPSQYPTSAAHLLRIDSRAPSPSPPSAFRAPSFACSSGFPPDSTPAPPSEAHVMRTGRCRTDVPAVLSSNLQYHSRAPGAVSPSPVQRVSCAAFSAGRRTISPSPPSLAARTLRRRHRRYRVQRRIGAPAGHPSVFGAIARVCGVWAQNGQDEPRASDANAHGDGIGSGRTDIQTTRTGLFRQLLIADQHDECSRVPRCVRRAAGTLALTTRLWDPHSTLCTPLGASPACPDSFPRSGCRMSVQDKEHVTRNPSSFAPLKHRSLRLATCAIGPPGPSAPVDNASRCRYEIPSVGSRCCIAVKSPQV